MSDPNFENFYSIKLCNGSEVSLPRERMTSTRSFEPTRVSCQITQVERPLNSYYNLSVLTGLETLSHVFLVLYTKDKNY